MQSCRYRKFASRRTEIAILIYCPAHASSKSAEWKRAAIDAVLAFAGSVYGNFICCRSARNKTSFISEKIRYVNDVDGNRFETLQNGLARLSSSGG
jgi:hypothetical protein